MLSRITLSLLFLCATSSALELGFYPIWEHEKKPGAGKLFDFAESADREIQYDKTESYDLGLGRIKDGVRYPLKLKFEEIRGFLEDERQKSLVVIWFHKTVMWNEDDVVARHAGRVTKQMQEVGYKRVIILGHHSAGVHYVADTELKPRRAEQDADAKREQRR